MGDELGRRHFEADDFSMFRSRLDEETEHLASMFDKRLFSQRGDIIGFELEVCIVDREGHPLPINKRLLDSLESPLIVPELADFDVEINGSPVALKGDVFSRIFDELNATWNECKTAANALDAQLLSIGILPTIKPEILNSDHMSEMVRYQALNDRIMGLRDGEPLQIEIGGEDTLRMTHHDVMLEAATTSFQIHLQCKPERAVRDFNASLIASAPMVALAANSPFLFGNSLWAETRIPLFEQSIRLGDEFRGKDRVYFGYDYAQESLFELFEENRQRHLLLLPYVQAEPMVKFAHVRFQNGTIWRWNRPLIGFDYDGQPHLRIEHRTIPAGPTMLDCVANCAAFIGFVRGLVDESEPIEERIEFDKIHENFYAAARDGLDADVWWLDKKKVNVANLILEELLPNASKALQSLGLSSEEIDRYLKVVEERVDSRQNGATWQREWVQKNGRDFPALTLAYADRQESGVPVHKWDLSWHSI